MVDQAPASAPQAPDPGLTLEQSAEVFEQSGLAERVFAADDAEQEVQLPSDEIDRLESTGEIPDEIPKREASKSYETPTESTPEPSAAPTPTETPPPSPEGAQGPFLPPQSFEQQWQQQAQQVQQEAVLLAQQVQALQANEQHLRAVHGDQAYEAARQEAQARHAGLQQVAGALDQQAAQYHQWQQHQQREQHLATVRRLESDWRSRWNLDQAGIKVLADECVAWARKHGASDAEIRGMTEQHATRVAEVVMAEKRHQADTLKAKKREQRLKARLASRGKDEAPRWKGAPTTPGSIEEAAAVFKELGV